MPHIHTVCYSNDVAKLRRILDRNDRIKDLEGGLGITPLMTCADNGSWECLRVLHQRGADVNLKCSHLGWTAAHHAAAGGQLECLQYLVEHCGADVTVKNNIGETPLGEARESGQQLCVEYLEEIMLNGLPVPRDWESELEALRTQSSHRIEELEKKCETSNKECAMLRAEVARLTAENDELKRSQTRP